MNAPHGELRESLQTNTSESWSPRSSEESEPPRLNDAEKASRRWILLAALVILFMRYVVSTFLSSFFPIWSDAKAPVYSMASSLPSFPINGVHEFILYVNYHFFMC